ncbi:hypothetical protein [Burkholderia pyrrocinia]|uniref:hypothetical protein n=1 Tax=Burkholderia pyrrocinia TaxID=60550 RepID=UPI002AAFCA4D|nr:hypothetical protein [Burkholderia pyrrocinia]
MSIIDAGAAVETDRSLYSGVYVNAAVKFFQDYVTRILTGDQYSGRGTHAKAGTAKATVEIITPHGDVLLSSEHCLLAGEIAARLTFTAIHQEVDKRVAGAKLLTVVITENSTIVRVGPAIQLHKIGPSSNQNGIIDEIVVIMLSNLQHSLPAIQ